MTDPKGGKPESDHPHEDDFPLDLNLGQEGVPGAGEEFPQESMSASIDDFQFSGPAEELDFTEPADFTFPTEQTGEGAAEGTSEFAPAEHTGGEQFFGADEQGFGSPAAEEAPVEAELADEGIAELESAEEEEAPKSKFELPPWVRTLEWITVGLLAVGGLAAVICSAAWVKDAKQVTLILNIACPVLLGLIPYALWRSSDRWVTPPISALYTVMLALSTAALIVGTWFEGMELSRYDWQFSKTRVSVGKPRPVIMDAPSESTPIKEPEAAVELAAAKSSAEPAAAKTSADAAAKP